MCGLLHLLYLRVSDLERFCFIDSDQEVEAAAVSRRCTVATKLRLVLLAATVIARPAGPKQPLPRNSTGSRPRRLRANGPRVPRVDHPARRRLRRDPVVVRVTTQQMSLRGHPANPA